MSDGTQMFAVGACLVCQRMFAFNPERVPSVRYNFVTGDVDPTCERQPVCRECVDMANAKRRKLGQPEHVIHPDAYEPVSL